MKFFNYHRSERINTFVVCRVCKFMKPKMQKKYSD